MSRSLTCPTCERARQADLRRRSQPLRAWAAASWWLASRQRATWWSRAAGAPSARRGPMLPCAW